MIGESSIPKRIEIGYAIQRISKKIGILAPEIRFTPCPAHENTDYGHYCYRTLWLTDQSDWHEVWHEYWHYIIDLARDGLLMGEQEEVFVDAFLFAREVPNI